MCCTNNPILLAVHQLRALGSLELLEMAGSLSQTRRVHFLTVKYLGYQILTYTAGQEWEATSATGEVVPVFYSTDVFKGPDAAAGNVAYRVRCRSNGMQGLLQVVKVAADKIQVADSCSLSVMVCLQCRIKLNCMMYHPEIFSFWQDRARKGKFPP